MLLHDAVELFNLHKRSSLDRVPCGTDVDRVVRSHSCACDLFLKVGGGSPSEPQANMWNEGLAWPCGVTVAGAKAMWLLSISWPISSPLYVNVTCVACQSGRPKTL